MLRGLNVHPKPYFSQSGNTEKIAKAIFEEASQANMAGFITHMAPTYPEQDMEAFADPIKTACKEKWKIY